MVGRTLAREATGLQLRDAWDWVLIGGATSNVIMRLALKPVGYGVAESVVDSGNVLIHTVKRLRTTLSYLAVTVLGTEHEKALYRDEVDLSHRYVHSKPGATVRYNAFDPELQLWVAFQDYWDAGLGRTEINVLMWDLRRRIRKGRPLVGTASPRREVKPGVCPM